MNENTIKLQLLDHLNRLLDERIQLVERAIASAKESRDSDTKSSAGDKYETGRAMMQMELDKSQIQLSKARSLKNDLAQINPTKKNRQAEFGSLVICEQGNYFLSVAIGKISVDQTTYFCLSLVSPLGQVLQGKIVGDRVSFNGQIIVIEAIV